MKKIGPTENSVNIYQHKFKCLRFQIISTYYERIYVSCTSVLNIMCFWLIVYFHYFLVLVGECEL